MACRPLALVLLLWASAARAQGGLVIEEWEEPVAAEEPAPEQAADIAVRPHGFFRTRGGVDTGLDSARGAPLAENIVDLRSRLHLGLDARLSDTVALRLEARALHRASAQRGLDRPKAAFEPEVGEAYVDLYARAFDLRLGYQVVAFGAHPAFAPADALNPRDLREGFLLAEPEELKLPNAAVRARGRVGRVDVTAVYFPFFRANRYAVFGQDEALVQPALGVAMPLELHESIEDEWQPRLLETERPRALPWLGEVGLRGTTRFGKVTAGASWVWMYEKIPQVQLDPEVAALARAGARGLEPDPAVVVSVQDRLLDGEELVRGRYLRQHLFSLEAQTLLGSSQLDVDASYSPAQSLYDADLNPVRKATFTWVVGLSQAADSAFFYSVSYLGLSVPDLPSEGYLFLLEPATAAGAPRTVWFHALMVQLGYSLFERRLELSLRAAAEPIQRSYALAPKVAWREGRHAVGLALELYQGNVYSPFGYFGRNDQVLASWTVDLF
jgi:hypothetical protein